MNDERIASEFLESLIDKVADRILPFVLRKIESQGSIVEDKMIEADKAAEYLGISRDLVYRLCSQQQIPHVKSGMPGSRKPKMTFSIRSLEEWKREQEQQNCPGWKRGS